MKYIYYPGCSLEGTAVEYNVATQAVMGALDAELVELEDWSCCGASAASATNHLISLALGARNLALAEQSELEMDFLIPCSACFLNLARSKVQVGRDVQLLKSVNEILREDGLRYRGGGRPRHFLDIIANDFDMEKIADLATTKLSGVRVALYYGCQALRPYGSYDDPEQPRSMEPLVQALGADVHGWNMGAKCCGAALMSTKKPVALEHVSRILKAAKGADCIVTICPMCQMNLEGYQTEISKAYIGEKGISILYLSQLIALAFELPDQDIGLDLNLSVTRAFQDKVEGFRA